MALCYGYDGFTIPGDLNMDYHKITNLPTPITDNEPITKKYADTHYSGGSGVGGGDKGRLLTKVIRGTQETKNRLVIKVLQGIKDRLVTKLISETVEIKDLLVTKDHLVTKRIRET